MHAGVGAEHADADEINREIGHGGDNQIVLVLALGLDERVQRLHAQGEGHEQQEGCVRECRQHLQPLVPACRVGKKID